MDVDGVLVVIFKQDVIMAWIIEEGVNTPVLLG